LPASATSVTIGRSPRNEIALRWDGEVSRLNAALERVGPDWVLSDDRLSRNGSYVNGERELSRRVLRPDDLISDRSA
jgi:pSer/pThr/pTyr-binding forkhead associated (FHA) protein